MWFVSVRVDVWDPQGVLVRSLDMAERVAGEGVIPLDLIDLIGVLVESRGDGWVIDVADYEWLHAPRPITREMWTEAGLEG